MGRLDFKAIAIGAVIAVSIAQLLALSWPAISLSGMLFATVVNWAFIVSSKLTGGFAAGWIARREGELHGAVTGAIAAVVGNLISIARLVSMRGADAFAQMFWGQRLIWAAVGIAVAAFGGWLAVRMRTRAPSSAYAPPPSTDRR